MRVRYRAMLAADPQTGLPRLELAGSSGQIVAAGTTTALEITDDNNLPISQLVITANGFVPTFWVENGLEEVDWWDGTNRVPLDSNTGTRNAAIAAATAASEALAALLELINSRGDIDFPTGGQPGQILGIADTGQRAWLPPAAASGTYIEGAPAKWPDTFPASPHSHVIGDLLRSAGVALSAPVAALLTADTAQKAREAILAGTGSGTSNLTLGSTSTQAAPGDHTHADLYVTPQKLQEALASAGTGGGDLDRRYASGAYPVRGTVPTGAVVKWYGPVSPLINATYARANVDLWIRT